MGSQQGNSKDKVSPEMKSFLENKNKVETNKAENN